MTVENDSDGRSSAWVVDGDQVLAGVQTPLGDLMGGLRAVDIARASGVSQGSLSRLWADPNWLDHVGGTTLSRLMAVAPPVGRYAHRRGQQQRLSASIQSVRAAGADVHAEAIVKLLEGAPVSAVIATLIAAAEMMSGRYANACRMLSVGWGESSNLAVDALFRDGSENLLEDSDGFLTSAGLSIENPPTFSDQNEIVGYGIVKHKLAKAGRDKKVRPFEGAMAFLERSQIIGRIFRDDDLSLVDWYRSRVAIHHDLAFNEVWSHATYSNDMSTQYRRLPKPLSLKSTAAAAIRDLELQNDAYRYYLLTVALPLLLKADPSFGGRRQSIVGAILGTTEHCSHPRVRVAAKSLHSELTGRV